eukprot:SAG31_NODE_1343_length_8700_cov_1.967911_12_plen_75_part_01
MVGLTRVRKLSTIILREKSNSGTHIFTNSRTVARRRMPSTPYSLASYDVACSVAEFYAKGSKASTSEKLDHKKKR